MTETAQDFMKTILGEGDIAGDSNKFQKSHGNAPGKVFPNCKGSPRRSGQSREGRHAPGSCC